MSDYDKGWEMLAQVTGNRYIGDHLDELTIDQQLQAAQAVALLSIAQELSYLNPRNISTRDADGNERNGWGFKVHK